MNKPGTLIAIHAMAWVAIGLNLLLLTLAVVFVMIEGTPYSLYNEIRLGFADAMGIDLSGFTGKARLIGQIIGFFGISLLKFFLIIAFIRNKMFKSLLVSLIIFSILELLTFNIYSLILLIIFLSGISRIKEYMKKEPFDPEQFRTSGTWKDSI